MKRAFLFLLCIGSLSVASAAITTEPDTPPSLSELLVKNKLTSTEASKAEEDKIFSSRYLGHVLYLASATHQAQYVEVTITTAGYTFKSSLKSDDGKRIKAIIYPDNYTTFIVDGPVGHYSYSVKVISAPAKGTFLDPGKRLHILSKREK